MLNFSMKSLAVALVAVSLPALATTKAAKATKDIVDTAMANDKFTTLVTAVKTADLVATLKGKGPFTVFAPTNDAFAKVPKADLDALLANKEKLADTLKYHVVAGKWMAAEVLKKNGQEVATVEGGKLKIHIDGKGKDAKVWLEDANGTKTQVVMADVLATNGVIHAIDTVVMPKHDDGHGHGKM